MKYTEHVLQDKESTLYTSTIYIYIDTELFKERSFISLLGDPVIFFGCQSPERSEFFHDIDFKTSR